MIYRDGLRVKVNGTTLVDDWKCQQMLQQRSVAVESLGSPLSLVVEYFSGGGVFGVEISVTEASGRTVNAPFGYVPQTLLSYRVTQGRLYRGLTLASMMPIVFSNFQPQSFAVAPLLPAGVEIANGIVFGTPRSDAPEGFFTVTAVGAQGSAETTLRLDVQTMLPPTQLRLEDAAGNNVTRVSVPQFQRLVPLTLRWSGRVSDYSVYPSLPRGLAFDGRRRRCRECLRARSGPRTSSSRSAMMSRSSVSAWSSKSPAARKDRLCTPGWREATRT